MSWHLAWHPAALHAFYELPVRVAERLDAAVLRLADGHIGEAEKIANSRLMQLRVHGAVAFFSADRSTGLIYVLRVFPRG